MDGYAKKGDRVSNRELYGRMGTALTDDTGAGAMVAQDDGGTVKWAHAQYEIVLRAQAATQSPTRKLQTPAKAKGKSNKNAARTKGAPRRRKA